MNRYINTPRVHQLNMKQRCVQVAVDVSSCLGVNDGLGQVCGMCLLFEGREGSSPVRKRVETRCLNGQRKSCFLNNWCLWTIWSWLQSAVQLRPSV